MEFHLLQFALGLLAAGVVALMAHRFSLLARSGTLAAFGLGTVVFGLGGLRWAIVLLVFFITSSGLSRLFRKRKSEAEDMYAKGSRRDARQVLANGGLAGLFVLLHFFFPQSAYPWIGFCGALAAANADTWATELGALSRTAPRLIVSMKPVEAGTSGAVSALGLSASVLGAMLIALTGALFDPLAAVRSASFVLIVLSAAGIAGSLADSWLGATLQAVYYCPQCRKETERNPQHWCGTATERLKGVHWMDNDMVNLLCTCSGAITALLILLIAGI